MPARTRSYMHDLTLRASGLVLLLIGALAMRHLFYSVHLPPRHEASAVELLVAGLGFVSLSAGAGLTALGAHIFDQVEVSERWRHLHASSSAGRPSRSFMVSSRPPC